MADSPYFKEQKNIEKPKMIFFFFFFLKKFGGYSLHKTIWGTTKKCRNKDLNYSLFVRHRDVEG